MEKAYKRTEYCFALLVPMLALCIVLIFIPAFASMVIRPDLIFELEDHTTPARRRYSFLYLLNQIIVWQA